MTPYFEKGRIRIYLGDWRDVMPSLPADFDLVITSPPYNLGGEPWPHLGHWKPGDGSGSNSKWRNGSDASNGVRYGVHVDRLPHDEYVRTQREFLKAAWDATHDKGAIFYNHKPRVIGAKLWSPLELVPDGLTLRQIITWARPGGMNFNPTAFVPTYEWILLLAKSAFRLKSKAVSGMGDVWRMTPDKNRHPAPFPLALPARCIEATDATSVLDPFMGSGTTLVAAESAGCGAVGIEIDERYCEMAADRLRQGLLQFQAVAP